MSGILKEKELQSGAATNNCMHMRYCRPCHVKIDKANYNWVCDMYHKSRCVSGQFIKEKALKMAGKVNAQLPLV